MIAKFVKPPEVPPSEPQKSPPSEPVGDGGVKKHANRYPWHHWLNVGVPCTRVLEAGTDYPDTVADVWMMQAIYRRARNEGVKISLSIRVRKITIRVLGKRKVVPDPRAARTKKRQKK